MSEYDPTSHAAVQRAVKAGTLIRPSVCEECGQPPCGQSKLHAHHADYAKPLEVEWLCPKCHAARGPGINGVDKPRAFVLRTGPSLHQHLSDEAARRGTSLNGLVIDLLEATTRSPEPPKPLRGVA